MPSTRQVMAVPVAEPLQEIKDIIQRNIVEEEGSLIGSHQKQFVKGKKSGLVEDVDVQLKNLKASSSKCVTLADRITGKSNKFTSYVSAFANYRGGHIYYGINDAGIVEGETITKKEQEEVLKKVTKIINKMVWPQKVGKHSQRGTHWDIFFEPVQDTNGNAVPSTFVIVIYVASCSGGVFTEEPESYHLVGGEVQKMSFQDWWENFTGVGKHARLLSVPSRVSRLTWSSKRNRRVFEEVTTMLIQHRNDEKMKDYNALCKVAVKHFADSNAALVVTTDNVIVASKSSYFGKAKSLLEQFPALLASSKDSSIFEVIMLLLQCMIERMQGNNEICYEIVQRGLQLSQLIPVELYSIWFYFEAAMSIILILAKEHDLQKHRFLKDSAQNYLEVAARHGNSLEDLSLEMSEIQSKVHIYKAWVFLECPMTGDEIQQKRLPSYEDIEAARRELSSVAESVLKRCILTNYRKIQYHLAECDLFRRRSEILTENYISNLKHAFQCGSTARDLAKRHHFEIMVGYANKRLADLTEKLVRHAIHSCGKHPSRNLLGFEY